MNVTIVDFDVIICKPEVTVGALISSSVATSDDKSQYQHFSSRLLFTLSLFLIRIRLHPPLCQDSTSRYTTHYTRVIIIILHQCEQCDNAINRERTLREDIMVVII